jgi:hypothetical protein
LRLFGNGLRERGSSSLRALYNPDRDCLFPLPPGAPGLDSETWEGDSTHNRTMDRNSTNLTSVPALRSESASGPVTGNSSLEQIPSSSSAPRFSPEHGVGPSPLLELTLAHANCVTKDVLRRSTLKVSTRRFYGFFVASEKHVL